MFFCVYLNFCFRHKFIDDDDDDDLTISIYLQYLHIYITLFLPSYIYGLPLVSLSTAYPSPYCLTHTLTNIIIIMYIVSSYKIILSSFNDNLFNELRIASLMCGWRFCLFKYSFIRFALLGPCTLSKSFLPPSHDNDNDDVMMMIMMIYIYLVETIL